MKRYSRHSAISRFQKADGHLKGSRRVNSVILVLSALLLLLCCERLKATVVDSSFYGFTVVIERSVGAAPDSVYQSLTRDVGRWWSSDHTWSGDARNLSIEALAGGCFCEKLTGGGTVKHMEVVWTERPKMLRMTGGLGPLQAMAVAGTMSVELIPDGVATRIKLSYTVGGYYKEGLQKIGKLVDMVLTQQVERLRRFVEGTL
ncbi:MAG: ATPase [Alphaproteobacteria bacterium]|nr:ATPase [Alphaproteobacteria bacterium]